MPHDRRPSVWWSGVGGLESDGTGVEVEAHGVRVYAFGLVVAFAQAEARESVVGWAAGKPIYGVNHVIGHVAVTQLQFGALPANTMALIVSGGHTSLLHVDDIARHIDVVGTTLDDAAGECFDKVARLLGFPYPGGPHIDEHARALVRRRPQWRRCRPGRDRRRRVLC